MHRILLNRGFIIKRSGLSTDSIVVLVVGFTATLWTVTTAVLRESSETDSPYEKTLAGLRSASQAPLIIQVLFVFWFAAWIVAVSPGRSESSDETRVGFWRLSCSTGPFDWFSSVSPRFLLSFCIVLIPIVVATSIAALLQGLVVPGILNLLGLAIFFASGSGHNPYVNSSHRYAGDMLRIALPTSHPEGTVYVLPNAGFGMDAVWSPKVPNEHIEADSQAMALFQSMRSGRWSLKEPLERIRTIVASYHARTVLGASQLEDLACWLYLQSPNDNKNMSTIRCHRAAGVHLIGRDLMYALCHAEYLVFMGQQRLSPQSRDQLGLLRLMKRSGASSTGSTEPKTVGFTPGVEGYREAVQYIYNLFNEPLDESAVGFGPGNYPTFSPALSKAPTSTIEYVGDLWDVCLEHTESTFTALYMFTTVWFIEVGNTNGFHIFPLRCRSRQGDLVSQHIVWRQAWYCGLIAQLVTTSPVLFSAFVGGYLR